MLNLKKHWHIYAILLLTFLSGLFFAWIFRNQINPDGVSYIQVARDYAHFDLKAAINGYWSPLLSWLLVPMVGLGIEPVYAYRALSIGLCLLIIAGLTYWVNRNRELSTWQKTAQILLLGSFGILLNQWSNSIITPDVLSGAILLLCIAFTYLHFRNPHNLRYTVALGTLLALLYFSKSVGFYIAITLLVIILIRTIKFTKVYKPLAIIAAIFLILSMAWVALLFLKYEKVTISTSSSYNFALYGPDRPEHPQIQNGPLPPPYPSSVWAWDDPSYFKLTEWNRAENIWYFKFHFIETLSQAAHMLLITSPLVAIGLYSALLPRKNKELKVIGYVTLLVVVLTILAYSIVLYIEPRYLWFIAVPIIAFSALLTLRPLHAKRLVPLFALILLSSILTMASFHQKSDQTIYTEAAIKNLSRSSQVAIPAGAKVAGLYPYHYKYCFFSNTQCLGSFELTGNINRDSSIIESMRAAGVDYYADFSGLSLSYLPVAHSAISPAEPCFASQTGKVQNCDTLQLKVYKLSGN